jgi:hypothetical protein
MPSVIIRFLRAKVGDVWECVCIVRTSGLAIQWLESGPSGSGPIAVRLLLAKAAGQQRAPISAVPLLPWVIHKRTAIEILHNAMVPEASDDLAFTDLVRLAGP